MVSPSLLGSDKFWSLMSIQCATINEGYCKLQSERVAILEILKSIFMSGDTVSTTQLPLQSENRRLFFWSQTQKRRFYLDCISTAMMRFVPSRARLLAQ